SMMFGVLLLTVVTLSQGLLAASFEPDYGTENNIATANDGMVVSAHPLASEVGLDILNQGGNAVDAAIAMQYALTVTEPMMSGLGGGGFMMVYDANTKETTIINSREGAPAGADADMFLEDDGEAMECQDRVIHGNSVGVPGTPAGLQTSHDMWGTIAMPELIAPAVSLAEEGFPIDDFMAYQI